MNEKMKKVLGFAVIGVFLSVGYGQRDAIARALGRVYGNSLHIENEPRANTATRMTLGNDDAYIKGDVEIDGSVYFDGQKYAITPSTETIAAAGTITANACGGYKRITSSGGVTTSTSNTFTAPASTNAGCMMLVQNVGSADIILDSNSNFATVANGNITLAAHGSVMVWSDGSIWRHGPWTEY